MISIGVIKNNKKCNCVGKILWLIQESVPMFVMNNHRYPPVFLYLLCLWFDLWINCNSQKPLFCKPLASFVYPPTPHIMSIHILIEQLTFLCLVMIRFTPTIDNYKFNILYKGSDLSYLLDGVYSPKFRN